MRYLSVSLFFLIFQSGNLYAADSCILNRASFRAEIVGTAEVEMEGKTYSKCKSRGTYQWENSYFKGSISAKCDGFEGGIASVEGWLTNGKINSELPHRLRKGTYDTDRILEQAKGTTSSGYKYDFENNFIWTNSCQSLEVEHTDAVSGTKVKAHLEIAPLKFGEQL